MTMMAAALKRAGYEKLDVEIDIALAKLINKGVTIERLLPRVYAAYGLPSEARMFLPQGQNNRASARQQGPLGHCPSCCP